jgi:membrane-associated protease RseP (regulator of RpoE activity)
MAWAQALDGGYLALLLAEAVRGKKLEQKLEQGIMASGFLLITAVGLLLVLRDTLNLTLSTHL